MATDNVQRPFTDILSASLPGVTHLCEVSVFENRTQDAPETVCACCAAVDAFFAPEELLRLASQVWRTLDASDIDLKAALVRDFPLLYLEIEKVVNTSALTFSKSPPTSPGETKPRLISVGIPIDLAKMSQLYPELGFYLRFFIDSSSLDLLSLDGKRRLLGLSWNYSQSKLECVCVKRGDYLVWHDPEHINESMVVALMKADIGQTKGHLVGDDVELGPGFECLMRVSLRLRPLGLASVSFSAVDLKLELEDLTAAGVLASLRMVSLEGLLGIGTRLLALEREISESFRVRVGVVRVEEEGTFRSLLGMRGRVSAKRSSIMSWWSAFLLNRVVRAGVSAELLTLLGNLLRAFCSDLKSHLPRQGLRTSFSSETSVDRPPEEDKNVFPDSSINNPELTGAGPGSVSVEEPVPEVPVKPVIAEDDSTKLLEASADPRLSEETVLGSSAVEPAGQPASHPTVEGAHAAELPKESVVLSDPSPADVGPEQGEPSQADLSQETAAAESIAVIVESIAPTQPPIEGDTSSAIAASESIVVEEVSEALIDATASAVVPLQEETGPSAGESSLDIRAASMEESSNSDRPKPRYSLSDETTVREVQSFLESIEDLDAYIARK